MAVLRGFQNPKPWASLNKAPSNWVLNSKVKELYAKHQSRWPLEIPSNLCHSMTLSPNSPWILLALVFILWLHWTKGQNHKMVWICAAVPHTSVELPIYIRVEYGLWNK